MDRGYRHGAGVAFRHACNHVGVPCRPTPSTLCSTPKTLCSTPSTCAVAQYQCVVLLVPYVPLRPHGTGPEAHAYTRARASAEQKMTRTPPRTHACTCARARASATRQKPAPAPACHRTKSSRQPTRNLRPRPPAPTRHRSGDWNAGRRPLAPLTRLEPRNCPCARVNRPATGVPDRKWCGRLTTTCHAHGRVRTSAPAPAPALQPTTKLRAHPHPPAPTRRTSPKGKKKHVPYRGVRQGPN